MTFAALLLLAASNNQFSPGLGGLVAWIVCNARKRHEMGGWLLFYYWQLYSGSLMTLVMFAGGIHNYVPEHSEDPALYWLAMAAVVPTLVLFAAQVAVGTMLISVRTWELVRLLRTILLLELIAALTGAVIDGIYFPESLPADLLTIVPAIAWLAYWHASRRVRHVFQAHDWDDAVKTFYPERSLSIAS